jgi:hypothetical protein
MFLKDPDAVIDYQVDWTAAIGAGNGLQSSQWAVQPSESGGIVVISSAVEAAVATVRLSGGVAGHVYQVGNRIALTDGTIDERSLIVRVGDR